MRAGGMERHARRRLPQTPRHRDGIAHAVSTAETDMHFDRTEMIYYGIAGAIVAVLYQLGRAWQAGDVTTAFGSPLPAAAAIGAIAGILALAIRRAAG